MPGTVAVAVQMSHVPNSAACLAAIIAVICEPVLQPACHPDSVTHASCATNRCIPTAVQLTLHACFLCKCFAVTLQVLLVGTHDCQILALNPTNGSVTASMDWLQNADKAAGQIRSIVVHDDNQALVKYILHVRKHLVRYCRICFSLLGDNVADPDRGDGSSVTAQHAAPPVHPLYSVFYSSGVLACHNEQPRSGASVWSASLESLPAHQQGCSACVRVEHTNVYVTLQHGPQWLHHSSKSRLTFSNLGPAPYEAGPVWDKMFDAAVQGGWWSVPQILSAGGVLLTQASHNRVAVWHFPDNPD